MQEPTILPSTNITPFNATLNAVFTDLNPGSNISSFYQVGECSGFPAGAFNTPVQVTTAANSSGTLPSYTLADLQPLTTYCVGICLQDDTSGSGFICSTDPTSFFTTRARQQVITDPPYNIGACPVQTQRSWTLESVLLPE